MDQFRTDEEIFGISSFATARSVVHDHSAKSKY